MAAPNLNSPTKVEGKLGTLAVTTSAQAIVSNASNSGKTLRIAALYVSNVDGTSAASVNVDLYNGTDTARIAYEVSVPADATLLPVVKDSLLYLPEGWALRLTAGTANDLEAVCSYEEIS